MAACRSLASVGKVMAFGCTVVSTVTRLRSWLRNARASCARSTINRWGLPEQRSPAATWRRRRGQNVMVDQRAIGRFLGNGIRPVMGRSSAKADARVLGALLKIASAAFW